MMQTHDTVADGHFDQTCPPNPYWWQRLFSTIDAGDGAAFVELLTPDAQFRFGNAPAVYGSAAIEAAVNGFFALIQSSNHQMAESWCNKDLAGCEGVVTYTRHDTSVVSFPFANVFQLRGEKVCSYHIYADVSTLFTAPA